MLILADVGHVAGADYDKVAKFVQNGGLLIRFAGGRMASGSDDLVPVKLRVGGRYLGGSLAWAEPQKLAPFSDSSPFAGLTIPAEVTVTRQVLAEPSVELADRTWARLADGTPLVTAQGRGKGFIVLVHTGGRGVVDAADQRLYVDMMRRLAGAVGRIAAVGHEERGDAAAGDDTDGFGHPRGRRRGTADPRGGHRQDGLCRASIRRDSMAWRERKTR